VYVLLEEEQREVRINQKSVRVATITEQMTQEHLYQEQYSSSKAERTAPSTVQSVTHHRHTRRNHRPVSPEIPSVVHARRLFYAAYQRRVDTYDSLYHDTTATGW
jgi:hypothetical protein